MSIKIDDGQFVYTIWIRLFRLLNHSYVRQIKTLSVPVDSIFSSTWMDSSGIYGSNKN